MQGPCSFVQLTFPEPADEYLSTWNHRTKIEIAKEDNGLRCRLTGSSYDSSGQYGGISIPLDEPAAVRLDLTLQDKNSIQVLFVDALDSNNKRCLRYSCSPRKLPSPQLGSLTFDFENQKAPPAFRLEEAGDPKPIRRLEVFVKLAAGSDAALILHSAEELLDEVAAKAAGRRRKAPAFLEQEKTHTFGDTTLRYLLFERPGNDTLAVVFSAFSPRSAHYHYVDTLRGVPANRLYILDDKGPNHRGCYYLGRADHHWHVEQAVRDLISRVIRDTSPARTLACGSSKGGWAALYFGARMGFDHVLAGAPQFFLGDYLAAIGYRSLIEYLAGEDCAAAESVLNRLLPDAIAGSKGPTRYNLLSSTQDAHHSVHVAPLLQQLAEAGAPYTIESGEFGKHSEIGWHFKEFITDRVFHLSAGRAPGTPSGSGPLSALEKQRLRIPAGSDANRDPASPNAGSGYWILTSDDLHRPAALLAGIAFSKDSIVIGQSGLDEYLDSRPTADPINDFKEGRFSLVVSNAGRVTAKSDPLGQDSIFYYSVRGYWALSNSFLGLCRLLSRSGKKLSLNRPALSSLTGAHSIVQQLLSHSTAIQQIHVLPLDHMVVADTDPPSLTITKPPAHELAPAGTEEYSEILIDFAWRWTSRILSLVESGWRNIQTDVTGGLDSRTILALVLKSGVDLTSIGFLSNPDYPDDLEVARLLSRRFKFRLNQSNRQRITATTREAIDLWKDGNIGLYTPVYLPIHRQSSQQIHFHGAGGESLRQFFPDSTASLLRGLLTRHQNVEQSFSIGACLTRGMREIGVDPDSDSALDRHYLHFRARYHFGRNWFREHSQRLVTPLMSPDLVEAAYSLPHDRRKRAQIICDLLLLLEPELAEIPFDSDSKAFSGAQLESSPFRGASRPCIPEPARLRVFGTHEAYEPHPPARGSRVSGGSFRSALGEELKSSRESALSLYLFDEESIREAEAALLSPLPLPHAAAAAGRIIGAGQLAELLS